MVEVKIRIDSWTEDDPWLRWHGKAVDSSLNKDFETSQREKIIGMTTRKFSHEQILDLNPGRHTVEYGVTNWVGTWEARITVNEREIASAADLTYHKHLTGSFLLGVVLPIVVPIRIPVLRINVLTFPPLLARRSP